MYLNHSHNYLEIICIKMRDLMIHRQAKIASSSRLPWPLPKILHADMYMGEQGSILNM